MAYSSGAASVTGPYGHQTQLTIDTSTSYATSILDPSAHGLTLEHTAKGLLTKLTDARSLVHQFQYDDYGRLLRDANPSSGVKTVATTFTTSSGRVTTEITSAENHVSRYEVEPTGGGQKRTNTNVAAALVSTWTRKQGGENVQSLSDGSVMSWTEAPDPRLLMQAPITKSYQKDVTITTSPAVALSYVRTESSVAQCGASICATATACSTANVTQLRTQTDTTVVNTKTYISAYDSCGTGSVPTRLTTSPEARTRSSTYDALGRLKTVTVPGIDKVTINYDATTGTVREVRQGAGSLERVLSLDYYTTGTGQKGQLYQSTVNLTTGGAATPVTTTYTTYDTVARPTLVTLPGTSRTVGFGFDYSSNLVSLDPPGLTASQHDFTYEGTDLVASYKPPAVGGVAMMSQYAYNRDGQVTTVLRPDGDNLSYGYDSAGRLSTASHSRRSLSYTYDTKGRTASIAGSEGEVLIYGYSSTGSLLLSQKWTGPVGGSSGHVTSYEYDNGFRVTQETAGGLSVCYGYDDDGLIESVTVRNPGTGCSGSTLTNGTMTLSRDPTSNKNGLLVSTTVASTADTRTYNTFGELATYSAGSQLAYTLDAASHERDQLGRIRQRNQASPSTEVLDYTYDIAGRLTNVSSPANETYGYDANGNRTSWTLAEVSWSCTTAGNVDAQDRLAQCTSGGNTLAYTYTKAGDRLTRTRTGQPTVTYSYDAFGNLLSSVPSSGSRVDYVIDGQGRRVGKKVGGAMTRQYLWGSQLRPIAELDGSGTLIARYVYATHVNVPDLIVKSGTVYRVLHDHLGSVRAIVSADLSTWVVRFSYDAYGNRTTTLNGSPNTDGLLTFGFAGGLFDETTGLTRFGARDYDPEVGRWLQKDPIGFAGRDTNVMAYAHSEPVNAADPRGLWTISGGVGIGVQLGPISFSVTIELAGDGQGGIGLVGTLGGGIGIGAGATLSGHVGISDGDSVDDLAGPFAGASAGGGAVVCGAVDTFGGPGSHGQPVHGGGISLGVGAGTGASGGGTFTRVVRIRGE